MRSRLIDLVIAQLVHQSKLLVALESEVKLTVRGLFLFRSLKPDSNKILLGALQNSRISVPELFGPIPESYKYKIANQNRFDSLSPPGSFAISGPLLKEKKNFPARPSGNRGSYSFARQSSLQRVAFGQPRRARGSKNFKRGGRGQATQVSQPATRGAASRGRGRPRGGRSFRRAGRKRS